MNDSSYMCSDDIGGQRSLKLSAAAAWQRCDGGPDPLLDKFQSLLKTVSQTRPRTNPSIASQLLTGREGLKQQQCQHDLQVSDTASRADTCRHQARGQAQADTEAAAEAASQPATAPALPAAVPATASAIVASPAQAAAEAASALAAGPGVQASQDAAQYRGAQGQPTPAPAPSAKAELDRPSQGHTLRNDTVDAAAPNGGNMPGSADGLLLSAAVTASAAAAAAVAAAGAAYAAAAAAFAASGQQQGGQCAACQGQAAGAQQHGACCAGGMCVPAGSGDSSGQCLRLPDQPLVAGGHPERDMGTLTPDTSSIKAASGSLQAPEACAHHHHHHRQQQQQQLQGCQLEACPGTGAVLGCALLQPGSALGHQQAQGPAWQQLQHPTVVSNTPQQDQPDGQQPGDGGSRQLQQGENRGGEQLKQQAPPASQQQQQQQQQEEEEEDVPASEQQQAVQLSVQQQVEAGAVAPAAVAAAEVGVGDGGALPLCWDSVAAVLPAGEAEEVRHLLAALLVLLGADSVEAGLAQVATIQAMPAMKERQHTVTLTWCASCNTVCTLYTYMAGHPSTKEDVVNYCEACGADLVERATTPPLKDPEGRQLHGPYRLADVDDALVLAATLLEALGPGVGPLPSLQTLAAPREPPTMVAGGGWQLSPSSPACTSLTPAVLTEVLSGIHQELLQAAAEAVLPAKVRARGTLAQQLACAPFNGTAPHAYVQLNPVCELLGSVPKRVPPGCQHGPQARQQLVQQLLPADWVLHEPGRSEPLPPPLLGLVAALLQHSGLELYRYVSTKWTSQAVIMFGGAGTGTRWHLDPGSAYTTLYEVLVPPPPIKKSRGNKAAAGASTAAAAAAGAGGMKDEQQQQQQQSLPGSAGLVSAHMHPQDNSRERQAQPCVPTASCQRPKKCANVPAPGQGLGHKRTTRAAVAAAAPAAAGAQTAAVAGGQKQAAAGGGQGHLRGSRSSEQPTPQGCPGTSGPDTQVSDASSDFMPSRRRFNAAATSTATSSAAAAAVPVAQAPAGKSPAAAAAPWPGPWPKPAGALATWAWVSPTEEAGLVAYEAARRRIPPHLFWKKQGTGRPLLDICDPEVQRGLWEATGGTLVVHHQMPGQRANVPVGWLHMVVNHGPCLKVAVELAAPQDLAGALVVWRCLRRRLGPSSLAPDYMKLGKRVLKGLAAAAAELRAKGVAL